MKKFFDLFISGAVIASALVACNKTEIEDVRPQNGETVLTFISEKPEFSDEAQTRTAWDANSKTIKWSRTDKIRVALKVGENWQNASGNATAESGKGPKLYESNQAGEDASIIDFKVPTYFKVTTEGDYKFYGIYPSSVTSTDASFNYMPSITVTLPTEQEPAAGTFDASGDIMISESTETYTSIPDEAIKLDWRRIVAHGDITLKKLPTFEEGEVIRSITLTAQEGADLTGEHYLMLTTGAFSGTKGVNYVTIKAKDDNLVKNADGNIEFWFTSLPFTATSLEAKITTNRYVYTKAYTGISKEFLVNTRNILGISMAKCTKEDAPAEQLIADGVYVISTTVGEDDLMMVANTTGTGNYQLPASKSETVEDGKTVVDPEAAWIISFDADNECYYIQNVDTETYLKGGQGSSDLTLVASGSKTMFYIEEEGSGYHIKTSGSSPRWIGYNYNGGNTPRFALYSNDSSFPGIVAISPAKVNAVPQLVIDDITLGNGAAVTTPVAITPSTKKFISSIAVNGVYSEPACVTAATWLSVTYSEGVLAYTAEANESGTARTAYVSVKGIGDAAQTDDVVFSVTQPKVVSYSNQWVLVTNVSELAIGDRIVIVNTSGTKALGTTQNGNNRNAVDVTIDSDDNNIINITSTTQQITLGQNNSHWTFNVGTGYLYAASSDNNYLRTQTTNDANGEWAITINASTYVASILAQGNNTRNQLKNNGNIFSCYASGQTDVKIYKYHEDPNAPALSVSPATTSEAPAAWEADNDDAKTFTITPTNGTWTFDASGVSSWANVSRDENVLTVTPKEKQAADANSGSITITLTPTTAGYSDVTETIYLSQAKYNGGGTASWVLVSDVSSLAAGDEIIIANEASTYALGPQASNNRTAKAITASDGVLTSIDDEVVVITLEGSLQNWMFKIATDTYLYANSSTSNQLKQTTATVAGDNGKWTIAISDGRATIHANGTNTRNYLRFNPNNNSPIFACYASTSTTGTLTAIYKKVTN